MKEKTLRPFVERVRRILWIHNLQETKTLKEAGVNKDFLGHLARKLEAGTNVISVWKVAERFNVSIDYLLCRTDVPRVGGITLKDNEKSMLDIFKKLTPSEQDALIGIASALAENHNSETYEPPKISPAEQGKIIGKALTMVEWNEKE